MADHERIRIDRIRKFQEHGIVADRGRFIGQISLSAANADKVLRLLRRLKKLELNTPKVK